MALNEVLARLSVVLGLDTTAFTSGSTRARREAGALEKSFGSLKKVGGAIAGALVATGVGEIANAFRDATRESLETANAIGKTAQLANAGAAEFQKASFAAKAVGIDSEKLADIYKDVNDKIGDFLATGGGEMKDFFENVGPKVGVTAEQFAKLSGPQALQLYVSSLEKAGLSQQQMTFYMEALANDATALLPLLRDNGAAFNKLAEDAEALGIVMSDQQIAEAADALKQYTQLQEVLAAKQAKVAIDNKEAFLAYEETVGNLKLASITAIGEIGKFFGRLSDWQRQSAADARANGTTIQAGFRQIGEAIASVARWFEALPGRVTASMQRLYQGVKTWLSDRLGGILDGVKSKVQSVGDWFYNLYDRVVGNSYVPDMVDGIEAEMKRLDQAMVDPAAKATAKTADGFRSMAGEVQGILDRLFPQLADARRYAAEAGALTAGIADPAARASALRALGREQAGLPTDRSSTFDLSFDPTAAGKPLDAMTEGLDKLVDRILGLGDKAKVTTVQVAKSFKDMADATLQSLGNLSGAIKGGGFLDILSAVIGLGTQLGSIGVFGKTIAGRLNAPRGYATGTASAMRGLALVGERGPELVNFRGGERVYTNRETRGMMGGGNTYHFTGNLMTAEFWAEIQANDERAARSGAGLAQMQLANSRRWSLAG